MPLVLLFLLNLLIHFDAGYGKETVVSFYMHDNVLPPNQTALSVAPANNNGGLSFGTVTIIDDALTEGASQTSNLIGRSQGTWMVTSLDGSSLLMTFAVVFQTGEFNGSTISLHGSDRVMDPVRELAVIGGTGEFRFARGYAKVTTETFTSASVTLKIDITVSH